MLTPEVIDKKIERVQEEIALAEKCMAELSQRKQELEVTIGQLKNIKTEQIGGGAKHSELYWYIDSISKICSKIESVSLPDEHRYEIGNYYLTSEDAIRAEKQIRLFRLLDRFSRQNGWTDELWEDDEECKYYIFFDHVCNQIRIGDGYCTANSTGVYFASEVVAQQAIEKYHDLIMEVMKV